MVVKNLAGVRALLLDLDGVVYLGNRLLPGAVQFFDCLRSLRLPFCLITNNSTLTCHQFAAKLARLGIAVDVSEILTSAEATADYLASAAPPSSRVLVIGGTGLREAVHRAGFGASARRPDYVVVGLDLRVNYGKLRRATLAIRDGARFVASNADPTLPTETGEIPGSGAIVAALQTASGVSPTVIGKPQPLMLEMAMKRLGVNAAETAIVGDRLDTDVLAGQTLSLRTVLVLTGVTSAEEVAQANVKPDFVFADLPAFQRALLAARGETRSTCGEGGLC